MRPVFFIYIRKEAIMRVAKTVKSVKTPTRKSVSKAIAKQDAELKAPLLTHEQIQNAIRLKAYELYEQKGCVAGNDEANWLAAEKIVLESIN